MHSSLQVRKCLMTGLAVNIAELQRENHYVTMASRQRAKVHPSSILAGKPRAKYIVFTELVATQQRYMRTVCTIEQEWIDEVVPNHIQIRRLFDNVAAVPAAPANGPTNGNASDSGTATHTGNGTNGTNGAGLSLSTLNGSNEKST